MPDIDFDPQLFVSAKGFTDLLGVTGTSLGLAMALENGTTLALAATNPLRDVYINTPEQD